LNEATAATTTTILLGRAVLSGDELLFDHGVVFRGGRIERIAPVSELSGLQGQTLDLRDQLILPGFINGHTHMYGVLSHGIPSSATVTDFSSFLSAYWWPYVEARIDRELAELTAAWSCSVMTASGVTCFVDILEAPFSVPGVLEQIAGAVRKSGLRGYLSIEASERAGAAAADAALSENDSFAQAHAADPAIRGMMSIHTLFTCPPAFVQKAARMARESGSLFHMHLSESTYEPEWCERQYGKRTVEVYDSLGCLDSNVLASQMVQVSPAEIAQFAASGAAAVSMPLSNCEVGGGVAPVPELLDAGVRVGLGSDGYIDNFFEVMRGAFLIHKAYQRDPQAMPARQVYGIATSLGAEALGRSDIGRIAPGCAADVITVLADAHTPVTKGNIYDQLVLFRNPDDVKNVFVGGERLKANGRLTRLDQQAIGEQMRAACVRFWSAIR
jgi:cytosine/adenosine deaminase-related metal-dependent hydrolase